MSPIMIEPAELASAAGAMVFDCRFDLADPAAGARDYAAGHIPGAFYLHLDNDLSGPRGEHGGRHPLPAPAQFAATLARYGVGPDSEVVAYDDSRLAFASRLWWLMRAAGYRPPRLLNGGYAAWLGTGGRVSTRVEAPLSVAAPATGFAGYCDIEGLREQQAAGALLVDAREERRYLGLEEPIDPVAGHIPGAVNRPWLELTEADGRLRGGSELRDFWGDVLAAERLVVYCGSGVTACVNLLSLALLGRDDALLYAGSWSDWCSYLPR
jgi:thiosulfate/3-mercaptopyruvate sulfurtransferase